MTGVAGGLGSSGKYSCSAPGPGAPKVRWSQLCGPLQDEPEQRTPPAPPPEASGAHLPRLPRGEENTKA